MLTLRGFFLFMEAIVWLHGIYIGLVMLNWYNLGYHLEDYGVPFDVGCPTGWKFILTDIQKDWCFYKPADNQIMLKKVILPYVLIWCLSQCYIRYCVLYLKFKTAMICLMTFLFVAFILFHSPNVISYYPLLSDVCIRETMLAGMKLLVNHYFNK